MELELKNEQQEEISMKSKEEDNRDPRLISSLEINKGEEEILSLRDPSLFDQTIQTHQKEIYQNNLDHLNSNLNQSHANDETIIDQINQSESTQITQNENHMPKLPIALESNQSNDILNIQPSSNLEPQRKSDHLPDHESLSSPSGTTLKLLPQSQDQIHLASPMLESESTSNPNNPIPESESASNLNNPIPESESASNLNLQIQFISAENNSSDNPDITSHSPSVSSTPLNQLTVPQQVDLPHLNDAAEIEVVKSREMSLSMDSNPDQPSTQVITCNTSAVITPGFLVDDLSDSTPNKLSNDQIPDPTTPPKDNNDDNQNNYHSPKTATSVTFPLPAKPPDRQMDQNQPLFVPSPTKSEVSKPNQTPPSTSRQPPVLSRLASLKQRVQKDPMDGEAWIELISDAEKKGDLEKTREVYSSFLQNFPDAANQWIAYADLELGHGHFPEVEQIFSRCLRSSVSVELWAFYLNYIRRVNPVEGDKSAASRAIIISAYDFSLNHIGIDRESGQIWLDYINIVKAGEASGTWQEQQKMDSLRKLYQRAVCIPLDNIEQLWKDYDSFEHQMSKMTAKKFLADKSAQYMMARSALKEMKTLIKSLSRPRVPVKPNWKRIDDHKQIARWKAYLAWEEKNPLEISDKNLLNTRIQYAYRQAIMHMRFHPEIWYLFASHLQKNDKSEEALVVIQAGLIANPTSIVLTYAMVELQENLKNYPACYEAFSSLVQHYHNEIDDINKTIEKEIAHGISFIEPKTLMSGAGLGEADQELTEEDTQRVKEEDRLRTDITALYKPKIDELREAAASVWITEMRFARRTEGIKPARAAFTRARKAPHITRHVFIASAMMEYHWNKDSAVATKVFDLGLKTFSDDVEYVLQYLDFLITLNDDSNARALFEKTVSKMSPKLACPLWRRWAEYEFIYGDKAASEKLNSRIAEIFPEWGVVERLSDRHTYAGLKDVLGRELGTAIEPIPLRRSPTPAEAPTEAFGAKRVAGGGKDGALHAGLVPPSGPASYRNRQRDRSFSPDFRAKRARAPPTRGSLSPDRRHGPSAELLSVPPTNANHSTKRGRDNFDSNSKRNRFSSPPRNKVQTPPPPVALHQQPVNPYAWFPDGIRYFLSILPSVTSFEGPRLDSNTVIQVIGEANIPIVNNPTLTTHNSNSYSAGGTNHNSGNVMSSNPNRVGLAKADGLNNNNGSSAPVPVGWGPNRGSLHGSSHSFSSARGNHGSGRRGRRK